MNTVTRCRDEWLLRMLEKHGLLDARTAEELRNAPLASAEIFTRKLVAPAALAGALWDQYRIPCAEPGHAAPDKLALKLVPEDVCRKHALVPLRLTGDAIEIICANPLDETGMEEVHAASGRTPRPIFGFPQHIDELIAVSYGTDAVIYELLKKLPDSGTVEFVESDAIDDATAQAEKISTPVIRLANHLIAQAISLKASDIHVEQEEHATAIRYRIDGVLRPVMNLPKHIGAGPLLSRIKIMAALDVADRRRPQDGRAKLRVGEQEIGLRVSTIPTAYGEKAVLRILDQRQAEVPLEALGFRPAVMDIITRLSRSPQGIVLVTGPTGSGKTTTLYSILNRIKGPDINVVTVEDPIEYRLRGINQVQVSDKAGMSFATVLRSVLRQDPDIILVGEIRDKETADIAFQAALTGHLVFSTLHTNDAVSTINRLLDMGVERFKLAPALLGIISQRLVRRVCPACQGQGCPACVGEGMSGRVALAEVLDLRDEQARGLLGAASGTDNFEATARQRGWLQSLDEDARWHLDAGDTTHEEISAYLKDSSPVQPPRPAAAQRSAPAPLPAPAPASVPAATAPPRVLIVDDNPDNRILVRDSLRSENYALCEAVDGEDALRRISEQKPDLVLLDLMMPGMDGFAVVKALRSQPATNSLPIIVITAMNEAESQVLSLELGANDYMTKPFNPKILKARVKAMFKRREYGP
ncbi:MAG: ATPase, T2SS/T4P/T4SS family [Elusimicrobiota bacterium]|jgi:type IV pilus assembly protein PilB